ncbi:hypothetical protein OG884_27820 [Streptosporangium sp. NBC_01755]|uniref:hypothetical protein n=1 Tax=unclassified Streptosporangium TaxID=2632669 RepID=UPI002DD7D854|nr:MULTISPECIES: hypothetical protein [unclassified Streptosporangium]WSA23212.1 hypothetical protein OIE13_19775 [Streptosporangium sp. NBC_01810]WSC98648.1 hypothetical protein OG884_27820 [Streptosporangium sp. NBC_01755]
MIGKMDHDGFGVHSERCGDEFGVHGVDQVDQPGGARELFRDQPAKLPLATDVLDELEIVVSELVTNATASPR